MTENIIDARLRIAVMIGSVRKPRMADPLAAWLEHELTTIDWLDLDLIDLATVSLPMHELQPGGAGRHDRRGGAATADDGVRRYWTCESRLRRREGAMTVTDHPGFEAGAASLTVGQVARAAGVTPNAVRFYERYGVITGHRNSGNARRFTVDAICRIKLALAAQRVGITLKESAGILAGISPLSRDLDQWAAAGEELVRIGRARIDELQTTVNDLATLGFLQNTP